MGVVNYLTVDGEILSETRNGVEHDYLPDIQGSTIGLLDSNQNITDQMSYWPYGEEHVGNSTVTPMRYLGTLGCYTDVLNGRVYERYRSYQPQYGRWMTVDPLWPHQESYGYAHSNPISLTDPYGANPLAGAIAGAELGSCAGPLGVFLGAVGGLIVGLIVGLSLADVISKAQHAKLNKADCDQLKPVKGVGGYKDFCDKFPGFPKPPCNVNMSCGELIARDIAYTMCALLRKIFELQCLSFYGMKPDFGHKFPIEDAALKGLLCHTIAIGKGCYPPAHVHQPPPDTTQLPIGGSRPGSGGSGTIWN